MCCLTLCVLQGASEKATPKKDMQEKGNENYQKVKEVRRPPGALSWLCVVVFGSPLALWCFSGPTDHLPINPWGRARSFLVVADVFS